MANAKDKATGGTGEALAESGQSLEKFLTALEEKVEKLSLRVRDLGTENVRLKGALVEMAAERDRLKTELDAALEARTRQGEVTAKLSRFEAEREAVRARLERLLTSLEEAEVPPAGE